MADISLSNATRILGLSRDQVTLLQKQGLLRATKNEDGEPYFLDTDIARLKRRNHPSLPEEAAEVGVEMQHTMARSITLVRKGLLTLAGMFGSYLAAILLLTLLFIAQPVKTAGWLGMTKTQTTISLQHDSQGNKVIAADRIANSETETQTVPPSTFQSLMQPAGKAALNVVRTISPRSYAAISQVTILDPNDILSLDENGTITPTRALTIPEGSLFQMESNDLIANLNSDYLQGKQPGTEPGDLAIVGETGTSLLAPASELLTSTATTSATLSDSLINIATVGPLSGGGTVSNGGTITLSCSTCLIAGVAFASGTYGSGSAIPVVTTDTQGRITAVTNTAISDLTNANLSGTAGITNANLATSSLSLTGNSGSGAVSLGGGLTFTGAGITNVVASGSTLTLTTTEADTLANVTGRGASTATGLTLNGGITTTTTTNLTLDSGTTGGISIGTGAHGKIITIGNTTVGTGITIQSGTGNITFMVDSTSASGKVQIGTSGTTTPDLLVLDNGTADPAGVNGGTYYNTTTSTFRCYQSGAWIDCIAPGSLAPDPLHATVYDTDDTMTNVPTGGAQVTLGTVSVTPTTATRDVYVNGWADVYSSNGADQPFHFVIETTSDCTGVIVGNASVTYTITTGASGVNDRGSLRISGIALNPGTSAQAYSLCAAIASGIGDTDVLNWGMEALVL